MEEKKSSLGLYIGIIALLVGVANIFLGVLPTVEMKGKVEAMETRVAKAEKTADAARAKLEEWKKKRAMGAGGGSAAPMPMPVPPPVAPLPPK